MASGTYNVYLCGRKSCVHPGGQHRMSDPAQPEGPGTCLLCDCTGWVENGMGDWSDRMTDEALRRYQELPGTTQ